MINASNQLPLERDAVVGERGVVLGCAIDELEHPLRGAASCGFRQIPDVEITVELGHYTASITMSRRRLPVR